MRKEFPNAVFTKVDLDRDKGLYEYELDFYTAEVRGEMKFNPETGAVLEKEIKYNVHWADWLQEQTPGVCSFLLW